MWQHTRFDGAGQPGFHCAGVTGRRDRRHGALSMMPIEKSGYFGFVLQTIQPKKNLLIEQQKIVGL
jgi:hypothetical protein